MTPTERGDVAIDPVPIDFAREHSERTATVGCVAERLAGCSVTSAAMATSDVAVEKVISDGRMVQALIITYHNETDGRARTLAARHRSAACAATVRADKISHVPRDRRRLLDQSGPCGQQGVDGREPRGPLPLRADGGQSGAALEVWEAHDFNGAQHDRQFARFTRIGDALRNRVMTKHHTVGSRSAQTIWFSAGQDIPFATR